MIDEKQIAEFLRKWRQSVELRGVEVHHDVMQVLEAAVTGPDQYEPTVEIAKTLCELIEPERLGQVICMRCRRPVFECGCENLNTAREES